MAPTIPRRNTFCEAMWGSMQPPSDMKRMIVNGKVRMYFGPFPALLRIPLNFIYPAGHGKWSRISGFCAGVIALFAFAGLVQNSVAFIPAFVTRA